MTSGVQSSASAWEKSSVQLQVGKDRQGHWVVRDSSGLWGGVFIDKAEALRFALAENGHRPDALVLVPGIMELIPQANDGGSGLAHKAA